MPTYANGRPDACPPSDAEKVDAHLYRAIDGDLPNLHDFKSFAERNRQGIDPEDCDSWGLSVWPDMNAVAHARRIFPCFRKKNIVRFTVTKRDGCLKFTPSRAQPDHHTFWMALEYAGAASAQIVLGPEGK